MQILREYRNAVLIVLLLVVILIVALIIVQNVSKPSPTPSLYPGEVTQYQGQKLMSISGFLGDINLHPDVAIDDLLQEAGASPNSTTLIFTGSDGYTTALPLGYVVQNNLILAYKVNNVTLPAAAGFPLMLIAQNQYGYKWIKWVTEINVSNDSSYLGYWESQGYPNNATVQTP